MENRKKSISRVKNRVQKMGAKKVLSLLALFGILLSSGVLGAWILGFWGSSHAYLESSQPLTGNLDFGADCYLDVQFDDDSCYRSATLFNDNGLLTDINLTFETTVTPTHENCTNTNGDTLFFLQYNNTIMDMEHVFEGNNMINLSANSTTTFFLGYESKMKSCPANLTVDVIISEI